MYKLVYELKSLGTFETFSEAFKVIYNAIKKEKVLSWQMLETTIWIEQIGTPFIYPFYEARDMMCRMGFLVNGKWVNED